MKRIVAFGCSHTYGHGLSDCVIPLRQGPSKQVWAAVLADKLSLDLVNCAQPGVGNKYILHQIIKFDFKPGDCAVILWSHCNRRHFFENENTNLLLAPWHEDKNSTFFFRNLSFEYDSVFESSVFANHANFYLKNLNTPYCYSFVDPKMNKHTSGLICDDNFLDIEFSNFRKNYRPALDRMHMGKEGHRDFAHEWYKLIVSLYPNHKSSH